MFYFETVLNLAQERNGMNDDYQAILMIFSIYLDQIFCLVQIGC
jgi:hypothetical protein